MKPTLEQLNELSVQELNCATAKKLGLNIGICAIGSKPISTNGTNIMAGSVFVDYCNDPRDYMPIAIEHGISIIQDDLNNKVHCMYRIAGNLGGITERIPKDQTGRAVCIAFLLMQTEGS